MRTPSAARLRRTLAAGLALTILAAVSCSAAAAHHGVRRHSVQVVRLPRVHVKASYVHLHRHRVLLVGSIVVAGLAHVRLSVSCGHCERLKARVHESHPRPGVTRYTHVDWMITGHHEILLTVTHRAELGRYMLLGTGSHHRLVFKASGCLRARGSHRRVSCPHHARRPATGRTVAGGSPTAGAGPSASTPQSSLAPSTAPETVISSHPASLQSTAPVTFTYASPEAGSTFQCSLDGSAWSARPEGTLTYAHPAEGKHTFRVRALTANGVADPTPASFGWTQDYPPATTITGGPEGIVASASVTFTFISSKPGSTFLCSLDGGAWTPCPAGEVHYEGLADAEHAFAVRAVDALGVSDPTGASRTWQQVNRYGVTSYDRIAPGAPYSGQFEWAFQAFTAKSNTITLLGVTVGNGALPNGAAVPYNVLIKLCTNQPGANGNCNAIAQTDPQVVNFGASTGDIGDISVTSGATYWIVYYPPQPYGHGWLTYWWAGGSTIESSDQMQAIVQGYDR